MAFRHHAIVLAIVAGCAGASAAHAGAAPDSGGTPVALTLLNGWTGGPVATNQPTVQQATNVVLFRGAIATNGTNTEPFVLPKGFRPAAPVYVPVDMCNATNGRLDIATNGVVTVEAETNFSNAQCFTSLDGVSFVKSPVNYQTLTLLNGWTDAPFNTSNAAVRLISGVVEFKGAIATTGLNIEPFVLPAQFRPSTNVYVPVDLCNGANGRLDITPSGDVTVEAETNFANAQCLTSLDGASFRLAPGEVLKLRNGWVGTSSGTARPSVRLVGGVVRFKGGMATSGTNAEAFVLPTADWPAADTYVKVDLCDGANGRLYINTSGVVTVQAETGFSNAQCFTSLDGASFVQ